jgi:hypothetical protein
MNDNDMTSLQNLYESETYSVDRIEEDGEVEYHINFFGVTTIHLDIEEWNEFIDVMQALKPEA